MKNIIEQLCYPVILVEDNRFLIKFAESAAEIEAAQRLRYKVFHLEQGRGKSSIETAEIDCDKFDESYLHLIVVIKANHEIVGTYRLLPGIIAKTKLGLYTATEYELDGIDNIINEIVEVGRSCVCAQYRNGAVIALLWAGIAQIMVRGNFRYLLGCVSLETAQPEIGWALYDYFCQRNQVTKAIIATPKAAFVMVKAEPLTIDHLTATQLDKYIPSLLRGYLRLGAKICGEPVFDPIFRTIDFLTLLDLQSMPRKYFKHFKIPI